MSEPIVVFLILIASGLAWVVWSNHREEKRRKMQEAEYELPVGARVVLRETVTSPAPAPLEPIDFTPPARPRPVRPILGRNGNKASTYWASDACKRERARRLAGTDTPFDPFTTNVVLQNVYAPAVATFTEPPACAPAPSHHYVSSPAPAPDVSYSCPAPSPEPAPSPSSSDY